MGEMVLVALALIAVAAGVAAWALHRRGTAEVHSVDHYQQALRTLQTVQDRTTSGSVRLLGPGVADPGEGSERLQSGAGPSGEGGPASWPPVAQGRASPAYGPGPSPALDPVWRRETRGDLRRHDRAMAELHRGPRRFGGTLLAAAAALLLVVALVALGTHSRSGPGRVPAAAHRPGAAVQGGSVATSRVPAASAPVTSVTISAGGTAAKGSRAGDHRGARATPTTVPASFAAVTTSANGATYRAPAPTYTLVLTSQNGPCWWEVRSTSTGTVLYTGTLPAGEQQTVSATGTSTVTMGAPGEATVSLDSEPVILPSSMQAPFTLTFNPASG